LIHHARQHAHTGGQVKGRASGWTALMVLDQSEARTTLWLGHSSCHVIGADSERFGDQRVRHAVRVATTACNV
jgi:hypothetical protein